MIEGPAGIDGATIAELLAEGATARKHPSGSCVMLTLTSGPPSLMVPCHLLDRLVAEGLVSLGSDGVYRGKTESG